MEEIKEQFESKMSDADLLRQIDGWEKESEEFYSQLKRVWMKNMAYYVGQQTDVQNIVGKYSKAVENRIFMATETMIPIATSRLPGVIVKPGDEDEVSQMNAEDLEYVLSYQFERVGIQALCERFLRDKVIKRYGVFKIGWNQLEDDVDLKVVDPRRIRVPRYGKNIDDLAFIIEDLELSYAQLEEQFGAKAKDVYQYQDPNALKVRKKTYSVKEVWTNDFVVWVCNKQILKKQENPYFDFKNLDKNFFNHAKKPYIIKSLFETEESIIGDTDYVSQMIPIQDNINIRKRQIEDIASKVANPPLLIDSDVMSEEEAANITNEPGFILYGKQAAEGTKIRFEQPGQVPQYLLADLQESRKEFDNIWGVHSTTRGEREGRETLGGRQLLREADLGRIDLVARQLERALDEIAEYWVQLIKLFYTDKKSFSILGEDGLRFVKQFTGKQVGNVKPMVKPGSTLKEDEASLKQLGLLLWQNKAIGLETLYEYLRLPNKKKAIDDFIQTQSGAILRPQGPQGSPTPLPDQGTPTALP